MSILGTDPRAQAASSLAELLTAARRRLKLRYGVRGGAIGLWVGLGLGLLVAGVSRLPVWVVPGPEWAWAIGVAVVATAIGAGIGLLRPVMTRHELALLVDRVMQTDELLVTALHLESMDRDVDQEQVLAEVERRLAAMPELQGVATRLPRHVWFTPMLAIAAALVLWLVPAWRITDAGASSPSVVATEGERIADRLDELKNEFDAELPEDVERGLEKLVADLESGELTEEEARERIDELRDELKGLQSELEESKDLLDELKEAAEELAAAPEAQDLSEAIADGDMDKAAEEARSLQEQVSGMSDEQRDKLGDAMERAGDKLQQSENPQMKELGEKMSKAGQSARATNGSPKPGSEPGADGEQEVASSQPGGSPSAEESLDELSKQLQSSQGLSDKAKRDAEKLAKSQQVNGALEASNQRLGGETEVGQGEGSPGEGQPGVGTGDSDGQASAGKGHTWEDEGTSNTQGGHQDANRNSTRDGGEVVDDFQRLYREMRLEGAESLIAGVDGKVDERGHIDTMETRMTGGDEDAEGALLDVPDGYRDAADRALNNERVPPGYRDAVKNYFKGME